jgi:hypothetical protein
MPGPALTIDPLGTPPTRDDPANFSARGDALMTQLPTTVTQINAVSADLTAKSVQVTSDAAATAANAATASAAAVAAVNAPGSGATSSTSMTLGMGVKSFTLDQVGKNFFLGQTIVCASTASPANGMAGTITAFTAGTGAITVNFLSATGTGTFAAWTVSLSAPISLTGLAGDVRAAMAANVQLTAQTLGSGTYTPTAHGLSIYMPDATTCRTGTAQGLYRNASDTYCLGVRDYAGNLLAVLLPGESADVSLSSSATAAGVWNAQTSGEAPALMLNESGLGGAFTSVVSCYPPGVELNNFSQGLISMGNGSTVCVGIAQSSGSTYSLFAYDTATGQVTASPVTISTGALWISCTAVIPVTATSGIIVFSSSSPTSFVKAVGYTLTGVTPVLGAVITLSGSVYCPYMIGSIVLSGGGVAISYSDNNSNHSTFALALSGANVSSSAAQSHTGVAFYPTVLALSSTGFCVVTGSNSSSTYVTSFTVSGGSASIAAVSAVSLGVAATDSANLRSTLIALSATRAALVWMDAGTLRSHGLAITGAATLALTNGSPLFSVSTGATSAAPFGRAYSATVAYGSVYILNAGAQYAFVITDSGSTMSGQTVSLTLGANSIAGFNAAGDIVQAISNSNAIGWARYTFNGASFARVGRGLRGFLYAQISPNVTRLVGNALVSSASDPLGGASLVGMARGRSASMSLASITGSLARPAALGNNKIGIAGVSYLGSIYVQTLEVVQ